MFQTKPLAAGTFGQLQAVAAGANLTNVHVLVRWRLASRQRALRRGAYTRSIRRDGITGGMYGTFGPNLQYSQSQHKSPDTHHSLSHGTQYSVPSSKATAPTRGKRRNHRHGCMVVVRPSIGDVSLDSRRACSTTKIDFEVRGHGEFGALLYTYVLAGLGTPSSPE